MTDLYAVLDIEPDATIEEIKKSYKREAQRWHPDKVDGDEERFLLVQQAVDVLLDVDRRARYDRTGSTQELEPIDKLVAELFDVVIESGFVGGDIIDHCRNMARNKLADIAAGHKSAIATISKMEKLSGRVTTIGENLFQRVIDNKLKLLREQQSLLEAKRKEIENVMEKLVDYSDVHAPGMMSTTSTTAGWTRVC